jgi:GAF domain-containing protein
MALPADLTTLLRQLVQIGIALSSESDLSVLLERILAEARRFTRAEAGTLFLREGRTLRSSVVANDALARRVGEHEMRRLLRPAGAASVMIAGYVAETGGVGTCQMPMLPPDQPYTFDRQWDDRTGYRTRSALVVPLQEPSGVILGVLELINVMNGKQEVIPFDPDYEDLVRALASQAAVAIRNRQLEGLSFKDALTGLYNRRYLSLRLDEEARRHTRFARPVSVVLIDLDNFKTINDTDGLGAEFRCRRSPGSFSRTPAATRSCAGTGRSSPRFCSARRRRALSLHERCATSSRATALAVSRQLGVACLPDDVKTMDGS